MLAKNRWLCKATTHNSRETASNLSNQDLCASHGFVWVMFIPNWWPYGMGWSNRCRTGAHETRRLATCQMAHPWIAPATASTIQRPLDQIRMLQVHRCGRHFFGKIGGSWWPMVCSLPSQCDYWLEWPWNSKGLGAINHPFTNRGNQFQKVLYHHFGEINILHKIK